MIRGRWDRIMRTIGRALGRTGVSPDTVTLLGVLIQVGAAWLILDGRLLLAGLVSIAAGISDVLDGAIAKAQGRTGKFGALLDSTTDRLADALFFLPIAWLYAVSPDTPSRDVPWVAVVALVALVAGFLVSYIKARAESLGFECDVGIAERAERVIVTIVALVFDILQYVLPVLAFLSIVTALQRIFYVRAQSRRAA
ncbi:MAG: CDP-alcohol phosphatidyltransferase family protein [Actinobacteria bacterium]|nr:CDP-alcohol phosphatidyltransferase family protein [Actinomycetota bacterium]